MSVTQWKKLNFGLVTKMIIHKSFVFNLKNMNASENILLSKKS
jgi:hypothetical protein